MSTALITGGIIAPIFADPIRFVEGLQGTLVEIEILEQSGGPKLVSIKPTLSSFVIGESKTLLLSVVTEEGPFDLTGSTVFFTVKKRVKDKRALISKTSDDVTEIEILLPQTDEANKGKAHIFVATQDTRRLGCLNEVVVDAWVVTTTGDTKRVVQTLVVDVEQPVTTDFS